MKKLLLSAILVLLCTSCSKDQSTVDMQPVVTHQTDKSSQKVDVCHNGHIINVSYNAMSTHREKHNDAVDMDGDGYFDIDNLCGPTDCDDTDPYKTDNCCPEVCGWCEHLDNWDFHEPCEEEYINGDFYINASVILDNSNCPSTYCDGCPTKFVVENTFLVDKDRGFCMNDTNNENDEGVIFANRIKINQCCEEMIFAAIGYSHFDYKTGTQTLSWRYSGTEEEDYELAGLCANNIRELARALSLISARDDSIILCDPSDLKNDSSKSFELSDIFRNEQIPNDIRNILEAIYSQQIH